MSANGGQSKRNAGLEAGDKRMISSMTGFANVAAEQDDVSWTFEIKSVNGRGLDLRLYLPNGCEALEQAIRAKFKDAFARGNMQASLQVKDRSDVGQARIDTQLLTSLARKVRLMDKASGQSGSRSSELLGLRGVMSGEKATLDISADGVVGKAILASVDEAIKALHSAREREGEALKGILLRVLEDMQTETASAQQTSDAQPAQMKARLKDRVAAVLEDSKLNPERLEQEVAILITKADVTEEIDRLTAHIEEARRLLSLNQPKGRKLDFLSQELLREANTLGSKAASIEMTRHSLALKSSIDQFKEQCANVE